ncbi:MULTISPECIES: DUF1488 family protein [unclassified Herbaspirillum]|uniref:DUF1488 family protein n=1 Tax=unclassified Herbaspirillum TaxID=2624150 RepID=UPI00131477B8|nr:MULTISPECIES: DUF1488 family protein [unclassified Herbaspirillum]
MWKAAGESVVAGRRGHLSVAVIIVVFWCPAFVILLTLAFVRSERQEQRAAGRPRGGQSGIDIESPACRQSGRNAGFGACSCRRFLNEFIEPAANAIAAHDGDDCVKDAEHDVLLKRDIPPNSGKISALAVRLIPYPISTFISASTRDPLRFCVMVGFSTQKNEWRTNMAQAFADIPRVRPGNGTVEFQRLGDGKIEDWGISFEALTDELKAPSLEEADLLSTFAKNRNTIHTIAQHVFAAEGSPRCILSKDFSLLNAPFEAINPIHHREVVMTAIGFETVRGEWRARVIYEKNGIPEDVMNAARFSTQAEAESNALAAAKADYDERFWKKQ